MALDIHIGKSSKLHKYCFSIGENEFNDFCTELRETSLSLNKLGRFNHYYSDVIFKPEELSGLLSELNLFGKQSNSSINLVSSLITITETASNENLSIFAFAD